MVAAVASVLIGLGALAFAAVAVFDLTHYSSYTLKSHAMTPTIGPDAHVWTRPAGGSRFEPGDILLLRTPSSERSLVPGGLLVISRVVAVAGQTVEARGDRLVVDNRPSGRVLAVRGMPSTITVPRNTVYVLGDNRSVSGGSNEYGPVPVRNVEQRVVRTDTPTDAVVALRVLGGVVVAGLAVVACWRLLRVRHDSDSAST